MYHLPSPGEGINRKLLFPSQDRSASLWTWPWLRCLHPVHHQLVHPSSGTSLPSNLTPIPQIRGLELFRGNGCCNSATPIFPVSPSLPEKAASFPLAKYPNPLDLRGKWLGPQGGEEKHGAEGALSQESNHRPARPGGDPSRGGRQEGPWWLSFGVSTSAQSLGASRADDTKRQTYPHRY